MSYSDEEEYTEIDCDEGHDTKLEELWSRKARRRSSALKYFFGDQLKLQDSPRIALQLTKNGERHILMSDSVTKINKKGRTQERWLMITDGSIYNIDPSSKKIRRRIALSNLSHISVSLFSDNFFLIHVPSEYDYVYVSGRKTEVVSTLREAYLEATGEELSLVLHNIIDYRIDKDQYRRLVFQEAESGVYTKVYAARKIR